MNTEFEIRILEVDVDKVMHTLESMGATKVGEYFQRRYVYDLVPDSSDKFVRIRDNGEKVTITYKDKTIRTISGTKELELEISDFDKANELLNLIGFNNGHYVENKRITYELEDAEFDIDTYPDIPTYMEIEGKNIEEVENILKLLNIDSSKVSALNCEDIYKEIYHINIEDIKDLKF